MATSITLNNGVKVPMIGLGTWKSNPGDVASAVECAIRAGYRHIDGAFGYKNEAEVGQAVRKLIDEGVIKREDVFITTKLWNTYHRKDCVHKNIRESLANFGLDYVDLYLMHWPIGLKEDGDFLPKDENGKFFFSDVSYIETYQAMEELVDQGLTKAIGLSNFNSEQITEVLKIAKHKPAMLQIEVHPYNLNEKLIRFSQEKGIPVTAYSPLGSGDRPWAKPGDPHILSDERIKAIADKYGKTTAQVVLRFNIQRDVIVIPKSVTPERIRSNFDVFDFSLTEDEMNEIRSFNKDYRYCGVPWYSDHKYYPFHIEF